MSTPNTEKPIRLQDSYGRVAKALGVSKQHLYLVCLRRRRSKRLEDRLETYLAHQAAGIGKN